MSHGNLRIAAAGNHAHSAMTSNVVLGLVYTFTVLYSSLVQLIYHLIWGMSVLKLTDSCSRKRNPSFSTAASKQPDMCTITPTM